MKNNKGFTLVELLAVISILAVILIIATMSTSGTLRRSSKNISKIQIKEIEDAAEIYYLKEGMNDELEREELEDCVNLSYLLEKGYLDNTTVIDAVSKKEMKGSVLITYSSNNYVYKYQNDACKEELENE